MFIYQAPNPYPKKSLFSSLSSMSSNQRVGKLIIPALDRKKESINQFEIQAIENNHSLSIEQGIVETYDDAMLDTLVVKPHSQDDVNIHDQRFIIKFNGNGMLYKDALDYFANDAITLNRTVVGFNYRGVGTSSTAPGTFQNLVTDGIAQTQRLLDQGVLSDHITLDGISLGGGVATMTASYFHDAELPVYLWNDRSFATLSKAAAGMVVPEPRGLFSGCFALSVNALTWSAMASTGWSANIASAYNKIDDAHKGHLYVAKAVGESQGDGVIADQASLHQGVKAFEKENGIKTGHKVYSFFRPGHNSARRDLRSNEDANLTGQDLFENFVRNQR